jgi:MFS family permease
VGGVSIGLLIAGLISPRVGRLIGERGGRPVLVSSSVLFALGLAGIGAAPSLPFYLAAWVVAGVAMGTGLYDAAFATLGRRFGTAARGPITTLTLFAGFASTVCWPLSAFLAELYGWRATCFIYAGLHVAIMLPLNLYATRGEIGKSPTAATASAPAKAAAGLRDVRERSMFALAALVLSVAAGIGSIVVVHLVVLLQARGLEFSAAIFVGTLIGPSQVAARVIERLFGNRYHPIWTMIAAVGLMAVGLTLLFFDARIVAGGIILYAAGYGVSWVARGTLPLALFGAERYPQLVGRLAFPSLIVQALAPAAGAVQIETHGANTTIATLAAFAIANVVFMFALWRACRAPR